MARINDMLQRMVDALDAKEKDDLYRYLWLDYVREDVIHRLGLDEEDETEHPFSELVDDTILVDDVAERYVYEGEYDCNLTYWENIDNLIETVKKAYEPI